VRASELDGILNAHAFLQVERPPELWPTRRRSSTWCSSKRGNTLAMVFLANVNSPLEPAMRKSLARLVQGRMDRANARLR
jgi:hypothetical protein